MLQEFESPSPPRVYSLKGALKLTLSFKSSFWKTEIARIAYFSTTLI